MEARTKIDWSASVDHLQFRWNRGQNPGQSGFHRVDDGQCRGFARARDAQHHSAGPVRADNIALDGEAVPHLRHILHVNRGAIHRLDGQIVQFVHRDRAAVHLDLILGLGHFGRARREDQVLQVQRVRNIERRKLFGVELIGVQVHHHRSVLAAKGVRNRGSLHGGQRRSDEVLSQVEDLLLAQSLAGKPKLQDGNAARVVLEHVGREHAGRHRAKAALHLRGHLSHCHIDLHVGVEVNPDHRDILVGLRLDVLDIVDARGEIPLKVRDDALLHLFRR